MTMKPLELRVERIHIYKDSDKSTIDFESVRENLNKILVQPQIDLREPFFEYIKFIPDSIFKKLSLARIFDIKKPFDRQMRSRDSKELKLYDKGIKVEQEIKLYDGYILQSIYQSLLPENEQGIDDLHIIITGKMLCTFEENDWRYHGRAVVCGTPCLLSTTGIVEAPARPVEYYYPLKEKEMLDNLKGRYIEYNDKRINDAIIGYILQSLFFFINYGEPFCSDKSCRLFNAHWQEDLIYSQIKSGRLCDTHSLILKKYYTL